MPQSLTPTLLTTQMLFLDQSPISEGSVGFPLVKANLKPACDLKSGHEICNLDNRDGKRNLISAKWCRTVWLCWSLSRIGSRLTRQTAAWKPCSQTRRTNVMWAFFNSYLLFMLSSLHKPWTCPLFGGFLVKFES